MANLPLILTAADYARLMPLATGMVRPDGIDLTLLLGRAGSWSERATMLRRALNDPVVHGGEASMAGHLRRVEAGDKAMSPCRCSRCATSPRAIFMSARTVTCGLLPT